MKKSLSIFLLFALTSAAAQTYGGITEASVRAHMQALASDDMKGRGSGTLDELAAAQYVSAQLKSYGIEPAGDQNGAQRDYIEAVNVRKAKTWNALGMIRGSDPTLGAILLSAHLDHLGIGKPVNRDNIYNGADDDASGVTAVLELAQRLAAGHTPLRTVLFAFFGSEERGGIGATYFRERPPVPLSAIAADLEFEMIGRADPAIKSTDLWLTGYDRSNLGPELASHGAHLVPDPHPAENFFMRSDNYTLALRGVVAHTVSSFGLHHDYHQPSDDLDHIDFKHMTEAIQSMGQPIEWLANSNFKPAWNPGRQPKTTDQH